jgi:hypothetical protein
MDMGRIHVIEMVRRWEESTPAFIFSSQPTVIMETGDNVWYLIGLGVMTLLITLFWASVQVPVVVF